MKNKDLRIIFNVKKKLYFDICNKFASKTARLNKKFIDIHYNIFLKSYVINISLPF